MSNRWLAIVNPAAGRRGDAISCGEALEQEGLIARTVQTRGPADASRIAREARDVDGVVAVGGDGTIHEILAGLDRDNLALAVMPLGHGNCLARQLGVSTVSRARKGLAAGITRDVDVLHVALRHAGGNGRSVAAASTVAVGYVARVVQTGRQRLGWLGRAAYAVASLATRPRPLGVELRIDGTAIPLQDCTGVIVNNTAFLANFEAFPAARVDDGRLDVMGLAAGWAGQVGHNASILAGRGLLVPALLQQATAVEFRLDVASTLMIDGELYPNLTGAEVRVLRGACRCVVGAA